MIDIEEIYFSPISIIIVQNVLILYKEEIICVFRNILSYTCKSLKIFYKLMSTIYLCIFNVNNFIMYVLFMFLKVCVTFLGGNIKSVFI